jgi:hypothetical protein
MENLENVDINRVSGSITQRIKTSAKESMSLWDKESGFDNESSKA